MEQIKEFTVLSVGMDGFKRFSRPFSVELGPTSYIIGANGQGKTAVADALAYAFCGTPLWGEKNCDLTNPATGATLCPLSLWKTEQIS